MDEEDLLKVKLSLERFRALYPDEEACLRVFPTVCKTCGPTTPIGTAIKRSFKCSKCHATCWRTAGTFFEGLHRLMPAFMLVCLIEDKVKISISSFAWLALIAYSTAWELVTRFRKLCLEEMMHSESSFGVGTNVLDRVIFRRSIRTPAEKHPRSEGGHVLPLVTVKPSFDCEDEKQLFAALTTKPLHVDLVAEAAQINPSMASVMLTKMTLSGQVLRPTDDHYCLKQKSEDPLADLTDSQLGVIVSFVVFMKRFGMSRKYLQLNVAHFWAVTADFKWRGRTLLNTCLEYAKYRSRCYGDYVSPARISMVEP